MAFKVEVKGLNAIEKKIKDLKTNAQKEVKKSLKAAAALMKEDIVETIESGNSPVKGNRRFKGYSENYKDDINDGRYSRYGKKIRPVNLKLSGRMLKSIAARLTNNGFVIYFTSKLAKIHSTEGPGGHAEYIRKVTPTGSEQWKASVMLRAEKYIAKTITTKILNNLRR